MRLNFKIWKLLLVIAVLIAVLLLLSFFVTRQHAIYLIFIFLVTALSGEFIRQHFLRKNQESSK